MHNLFLFVFLVNCALTLAAELPCGDWEPYKNEHCYKVINKVDSFVNAAKVCQQNEGHLIVIRFKEEQEFLENFLFKKSKVVDNVWLGAKFAESMYLWEDKTEVKYTHWAPGCPNNVSNSCVDIESEGNLIGKWATVSCDKKNLIVCQKRQSWSSKVLEETVIALKHSLEKTNQNLAETQKTLKQVQQNPVPIGFTYVQLPKDKSPKEIWPSMSWTDVSSEYSGVFFRVEGGDAAVFGEKQSDNAPRLTGVKTGAVNGKSEIQTKLGDWSDWCYTAGNSGSADSSSYQMSSGEVRPVNMAIRVWKRTG